jgi:hypothetical protein
MALACALATEVHVKSAPALAAGNVSAMRESVALAPVNIANASGATALQFDLTFNSSFIAAGTVTGSGALAGHLIIANKPSPDRIRVIIYSTKNAALGNGTAANIALTISTLAPLGPSALTFENVIFSDAAGVKIPGTSSPGTITIAPAFPPRLDSLSRVLNGDVTFLLTGSAGQSYILQNSGDLQNWNPFATNTLNGATLLIQDSTVGIPRRFYRALESN